MAIELVMPEMGEGVIEATISQWLKKEGDSVAKYEPILEVETDKVTTEITAEESGVLLQRLAKEGEIIPVGQIIAMIGEAGEKVTVAPPSVAEPVVAAPVAPLSSAAPVVSMATAVEAGVPYTGRISPVVGRIASEHQVDLSLVTGRGRDGRITKKDILDYVANKRESGPVVETAVAIPAIAKVAQPVARPVAAYVPAQLVGQDELVPLTGMRRAIAKHMVESKHTSPHVTTVFEVDFTAVAKHRAAHKSSFAQDGVNLTFTAYIVAAAVEALKRNRMVNSSWSDDGVILKKEINIGMAAAIEEGLIVPVIKGADGMNLLGLSRVINDLTARARQNQLRADEVRNGTFTITNHGVSGSLFATPIINQPQCGILGIGKIEKRVKVIQDALAIRPMAYVSLTFDHRILDGALADGYLSSFKEILEGWA